MFNFKPILATGLTVLALSAAGYATPSFASQATTAQSQAAQMMSADITIASGTFSGRSDHVTTGDVSIVKTDAGYQLVFADNFALDGAPDPIIGFGNNGSFDKKTKLSALSNKTGAQSYQLPADFTPAQFSEVYVFCEKFSVPLGVATLN
jgi:hypothetical protein